MLRRRHSESPDRGLPSLIPPTRHVSHAQPPAGGLSGGGGSGNQCHGDCGIVSSLCPSPTRHHLWAHRAVSDQATGEDGNFGIAGLMGYIFTGNRGAVVRGLRHVFSAPSVRGRRLGRSYSNANSVVNCAFDTDGDRVVWLIRPSGDCICATSTRMARCRAGFSPSELPITRMRGICGATAPGLRLVLFGCSAECLAARALMARICPAKKLRLGVVRIQGDNNESWELCSGSLLR